MSAGTQIDYDALAAQHGGTAAPSGGSVDYDALAAQHGGTPAQQPPKDTGVFASLKRNASNLIHLPGAVYDAFTKPPQNPSEQLVSALPVNGVQLPPSVALGLHRLVVAPLVNEYQKAQDLRAQAKTQSQDQANNIYNGTEHLANMHQLASMFPVLGPIAADIANRYLGGGGVQQDKSGAVTDLALNVAGPAAAEGAVKGSAALANKVAPAIAEKMYTSALKPSTTIPINQRAAIVRTGLDSGIPISQAGAEKLTGLIKDLNDKISGQIQSGAEAGKTINPEAVAGRVDQVKGKFASQVNPESDLAAMDAAKQEFLRNFGTTDGKYAYRARDVGESGIPSSSHSQATLSRPEAAGYLESRGNIQNAPQELVRVDLSKLPEGSYDLMPGPNGSKWVKFNKDVPEGAVEKSPNGIPVDQAQALKVGTYQQLKGRAYGELKSGVVEAQKALARGIKEELETQFPEIKGLNAQEAKFYSLDSVLERALNRIGNHQLMGIGTPIATTAGAGLGGMLFGHGPEAGAVGLGVGVMKAVLDNPAVKSRLAITLSRGGKVPPAVANARVNQFVNALAQSQSAAGEQGSAQSQ